MAESRRITPVKYHTHTHGGALQSHADHAPARTLRLALVLTASLLVVEIAGGLLSNSIALLADAGHMLTDVAALALSLFVAWFTLQPATSRRSFGYLRWEILAALLNGAALLLISVWIVVEAVLRVGSPEPVAGGLMLGVAVAGLAINVIAARILHPTSRENMNVRGAYLHVLGDLMASVGTVAAALIIQFTGWLPADPLASLLTTAVIVRGAWQLVRESVDILLESAPSHIDLAAVRAQLEAIPGIELVHDVHVWSVTPRLVAMSAHAIVRDPAAQQHVLEHIHDAMALFGIGHVTVQLEQCEMAEREPHVHA